MAAFTAVHCQNSRTKLVNEDMHTLKRLLGLLGMHEKIQLIFIITVVTIMINNAKSSHSSRTNKGRLNRKALDISKCYHMAEL